MTELTMKMLRDVFERAKNKPRAPGYYLILNQSYIDFFQSEGDKLNFTTLNTTTGEWDYSCYGSYADEMRLKWEQYWLEHEKWRTTK